MTSQCADGLPVNLKSDMKILIINTSEKTGGAAIAANRLAKALRRSGQSVKMLVRDKSTDDVDVKSLGGTLRTRWQFLWERFTIWVANKFDREKLFQISFANTGTDVTRLREFVEADVVHLHWVNQGMMSLRDIERIVQSGKPIVWTMHDMWPFTGVCHYNDGCLNFLNGCGKCQFLHSDYARDISNKVLGRKKAVYGSGNICFVACSKWLRDIAQKSNLLKNNCVVDVPNTIDIDIFRQKDKESIRERYNLPLDKKMLLFSSAKINDARKGFVYLIEACNILLATSPDLCKELGVIILGKAGEECSAIPFPSFVMDYIQDENDLSDIYNAADVFVTPSLQDNLPNTVMEALACGLPCVGFNVGGIPEMIDHKVNGYVSEYRSAKDLADGIRWVLEEAQYDELGKEALNKVGKCYTGEVVAERYLQIYNGLVGEYGEK